MKKFIHLTLNGTYIFFGLVGLIWATLIAIFNSNTSYWFPVGFIILAAISMFYSIFKKEKKGGN